MEPTRLSPRRYNHVVRKQEALPHLRRKITKGLHRAFIWYACGIHTASRSFSRPPPKAKRPLADFEFTGRIWTRVPCLTNIWLTSSSMSQPSIIIRSMARFLRIFSVSLTCGEKKKPSKLMEHFRKKKTRQDLILKRKFVCRTNSSKRKNVNDQIFEEAANLWP